MAKHGDGSIRRTLMCRDHEVCRLTYHPSNRHADDVRWIERDYMPLACTLPGGGFDGSMMSQWISNRAVPGGRDNVDPLLRALGLSSSEDLMLFGLGLSLTDQYWFKPDGLDAGWDDVKLFGRPFSEDVGRLLLPHDTPTTETLMAIAARGEVSSTSPDAALNGALSKFWAYEGGQARLYKFGMVSRLMLEPYCEVAATVVCEALLPADHFVRYRLDGIRDGWPFGSCPSFTDERTAFVPACDIFQLAPRTNHLSRYERYVALLEEHGIEDARGRVSEMLAIDHLIGNFDRHWGNFGVLVDSESGKWLRPAPLFDMGESFDCDRAATTGRPRRKSIYKLPFLTHQLSQMGRYAERLEWFDLDTAVDALDAALEIICQAPLMATFAGGYAEVEREVVRHAALDVERRAAELAAPCAPPSGSDPSGRSAPAREREAAGHAR